MANHKILIVEDEAIVAMQIEDALKGMGYEVVGVASRGNDAIRIAKDTWPDLILMDIRLDGPMDGIEVANRISMYYDIPVIFLTAYSDDATVSRAIKTRSYGFLIKPFNERELYSNIELAISKHKCSQKCCMEETIMDSTISLVQDAVISTGADGVIRRINDAAAMILGWKKEDVAGRSIFEMVDAGVADIESFIEAIECMKRTERGLVYWPEDVGVAAKSGEQRRFAMTVEPIREPDGGLRELALVFTPAKGKAPPKPAVVLEPTPQQVIDIIKDPVFFLDETLRLVIFNTAFQEFCALMDFENPVPKQSIFEILPPFLVGGCDSYEQVFASGAVQICLTTFPLPTGTLRYKVEKVPVSMGDASVCVATFLHPQGSL